MTAIFTVPAGVVRATQAHLRANGAAGNEGVVLWIGTSDPPAIVDVIVPEQDVGSGRFQVPLHERQRIARELAGTDNFVVAQVHSHPQGAFHSWIDDRDAIPRRIGSYSLVVPYFCALPALLDEAALFQLDERGHWLPAPLETFELGAAPTPDAGDRPRVGRRRILRWLIDALKN